MKVVFSKLVDGALPILEVCADRSLLTMSADGEALLLVNGKPRVFVPIFELSRCGRPDGTRREVAMAMLERILAIAGAAKTDHQHIDQITVFIRTPMTSVPLIGAGFEPTDVETSTLVGAAGVHTGLPVGMDLDSLTWEQVAKALVET